MISKLLARLIPLLLILPQAAYSIALPHLPAEHHINVNYATQASKADQAKTALKAEQEKPANQQDPAKITALTQKVDDTAKWAPGGTYRQVLTAITAASSGNVTAGTSVTD